ncbi:MAG: DUF3043 domain-containing protein [Actinomycetes bacterium]|jgi:hypothetical protein|nr:DUF3043 domain-containing protein [Actinomycetota bacterium]
MSDTPKKSENTKGKATPKRSAAVAKNKVNSITSPATKEGRTKDKAAARVRRMEARAAYMRGDQNALPARDKGPVKKYVRDYVDSKRSIGEYFLPLIMVVLVLTVIPNREVQLLAILFMYTAMIYSIISGFLFSRKIRKLVNDKFPGEPTKGLGMYGWLRSTQMRRMRAPSPQMNRGDSVN